MKKIVVVGAGGCAREVAWTARESFLDGERIEIVGFVVTDLGNRGRHDSLVLGDLSWLAENLPYVDGAVMGIGTPAIRARIADDLKTRFPSLQWPSIVHPTAIVDLSTASIDRGVIICASVVVTVNVSLGAFTLVHYGSTVSHEVRLGAFSVVNPAATLSGGVEASERVLVGARSCVLQYRKLGSDSIVGAGAVVTADVAPGQTVVGVPARPLHTDI